MADKDPTKRGILDLVNAQAETLKELSERLVRIEGAAERQEARNQNIVYAVLVAAVLVLFSLAGEVILSTNHQDDGFAQIHQQISALQDKNAATETELQILKAKNAYLK